jgi:hypothetical protein
MRVLQKTVLKLLGSMVLLTMGSMSIAAGEYGSRPEPAWQRRGSTGKEGTATGGYDGADGVHPRRTGACGGPWTTQSQVL